MSIGRVDDLTNTRYLCINFNQDLTSLLIGTYNGFKVVTFNSPNDVKIITMMSTKEVIIIERSFLSSLIVFVTISSPRTLRVISLNKASHVATPYCYKNEILAVKLNRKRLVVALETVIYVHDASSDKFLDELKPITPIPSNPKGLIALSSSDSSLLAYPGSSTTGEVVIYDTINQINKIIISAHVSQLVALAFDSKGLNIATASDKGTVIRVHDIATGSRLYEFRRGLARVLIHSLTFSLSGHLLCASSNTETVHIFNLELTSEEGGWINYFVKESGSYLPSLSKAFSQNRSFATAKLPLNDAKTVAAIVNIQDVPHVVVASADGYLYIYDFDEKRGGECNLLKQHNIDEIVSTHPPADD